MNRPFLSSLTRISDLHERPYDVEPLPRDRWETGDYVMCEVIGRPGPNYRVELADGRMCHVFDSDLVVGAFGHRAATLEGVGSWQSIADDGKLSSLTAAGLFGKVTSISPLLPAFMELKYKGHAVRQGKVTMGQFRPHNRPLPIDVPVIMLIGTSMSSGKTTSGRAIVHELKQRGLKVTAAKLTGAGRYRDVLSFRDAGADHIFDFVDVGLPSTVCEPAEFEPLLLQLLTLIAETRPDVLVAEAGASPLEPYNGSIAMKVLHDNIKMYVLCASDPYAVLGVQHAFDHKPHLVCGPAANTDAAVNLVRKLCGVPALNLMLRRGRAGLKQVIDQHFAAWSEDAGCGHGRDG